MGSPVSKEHIEHYNVSFATIKEYAVYTLNVKLSVLTQIFYCLEVHGFTIFLRIYRSLHCKVYYN